MALAAKRGRASFQVWFWACRASLSRLCRSRPACCHWRALPCSCIAAIDDDAGIREHEKACPPALPQRLMRVYGVLHRHLIEGLSIQLSAGLFLIDAAPLLEEERHAGCLAL